jgi:putative heme-binding domain-containing protein
MHILLLCSAAAFAQDPAWIWLGEPRGDQTLFFRKSFELTEKPRRARLWATCDNSLTLFVNGRKVFDHDEWEEVRFETLSRELTAGRNVLAVRARNREGPAGLIVRLVIELPDGKSLTVATDATWKATKERPPKWNEVEGDDTSWEAARIVAKLGDPPWGDRVNAETMSSTAASAPAEATPPARIKTLSDFKVELLYSVPKAQQGSWVNMTVDPKGRLIVSDQYGGLYRVTPGPAAPSMEPIDLPIGQAHGLLCAFDSLYVMVGEGGFKGNGLYRVRDTDGDDRYDSVELLRRLEGGGEHGPHAILLAPDGKSLFVIAGNHTKVPALDGSLAPRAWSEDHVVPRMWDAGGHAVGILAPGGWICRVDPDGKRWEFFCGGFRNEFDGAFNRDGELFTYDADMEWDFNTPWYRPTRVCHGVSGGEFGWRSGSGKWPVYYPDSLPPVVDIGPGSPTGVAFGYGARFPAKYQDALYVCDWSYGKLYAVHLTPSGATYRGVAEEFVAGQPLPFTDVVINPKDGAMYFTTGGRRVQSGLYRVTYVGKADVAASKPSAEGADGRALRRKLESFHGRKDPAAVEAAWPYLGHADRFIRFAARVAVEHQDVETWQERALAEKDPQAAMTAAVALARVGDKSVGPRLVEALGRLPWEKLTDPLKLELLRAYGLAIVRLGAGGPALAAKLDAVTPAPNLELNAELTKLLVALESPTAASKTMALLARAPTQEEQMDYVYALRGLKVGWTPALRKDYFSWFVKAGGYRGGHSFAGFVRNIKKEAVATLSAAEREELREILEAQPVSTPPAAVLSGRPRVKQWTSEELAPRIEKMMRSRSFDRGREMFNATGCSRCHRFAGEGGAFGPDLTGAMGRFSVRDLLESIVEPSKQISDQYGAVIITRRDGSRVIGRIINLNGDAYMVNPDMFDPDSTIGVDRRQVQSIEPSKVSMMPDGLVDSLHEDEIADLVAYLLSGGDRNAAAFR